MCAQQVQTALLVLDGQPFQDAQLVQAGQQVGRVARVLAVVPVRVLPLVRFSTWVRAGQQVGRVARMLAVVPAGVLPPVRFSTWVQTGQEVGRVARMLAVVLARVSRQAPPWSHRVDSVANAHPAQAVCAPVRVALREPCIRLPADAPRLPLRDGHGRQRQTVRGL